MAQLQAEDFKFADQSYFGGFNVRIGDAVVGVEADYLLSDINASTTDGVVTVTAKTKYLASVRGRVGMPIGPALLYATASPAFTEHKVAVSGPVESFSSELLTGGVFGGGIEASLTKAVRAPRGAALRLPRQGRGLRRQLPFREQGPADNGALRCGLQAQLTLETSPEGKLRFVIDANNFLGMMGLGFAAGLGWTAGAWLAGRILSVLKF